MEIRKNGKALDLGADFSIQIDDTNPVFNELGSQSVPATVPLTRRNMELMGGIHRTDAGINPNLPEESVDVIDGAYIRRGKLNVTDASRNEGITFNIGFDNSTAYQKWQQRKLTELGNLPVRTPAEGEMMIEIMGKLYRGEGGAYNDLAIFPIAVNMEEHNDFKYWEIINTPDKSGTGFFAPSEVARIIDGEKTTVHVPRDYGISPFIKVWRLLELVFEDLGLTILHNPIKSHLELERIVVLNNTADTICRNEINYRDLMPDCTVQDFLKALWVRFGLVYNVNFDRKTVDLQLLKDILRRDPERALDSLLTDDEHIRYLNPQYIKLSAGTSLEGAAPATERFEDYVKGLDVGDVKMGSEIWSWKLNGNGKWDRELYDGYIDDREDPDWDDPDYPDPPEPDWDDRDDGRDEDRDDDRDYYSTRSESPIMPLGEDSVPETILAREFVTGNWFKLDTTNGKTKEDSSSFFNWDPQPDGIEPFELSSEDECVAVKKILKMQETAQDFQIYDFFPMFMVGARHFHSYVIGNENEDTNREDTPLAFMIAYTTKGRTIGRLSPETENGVRLTLDDGTKPTLTLFFQFADGLFANFWKEFDEILRHGNREVEVPVRMSKTELCNIDLLQPTVLKGLRCLIDKAGYSLPARKEIDIDITLRALQTQGEYDIETEQNIPDFHVIRKLAWKLKEMDDLEAIYRSPEMMALAADENAPEVTWRDYIPQPGWSPVIVPIESGIHASDPELSSVTLAPPGVAGQRNTRHDYAVSYHYLIYKQNNSTGVMQSVPAGEVTVDHQTFSATLVGRWVPD